MFFLFPLPSLRMNTLFFPPDKIHSLTPPPPPPPPHQPPSAGIKKAWGIALIGAIGPFINGYTVGRIFYDPTTALVAGLCMTATAVSISLVTLKEAGLATSKAATGIMTSAVLDDIGSLALVAIMVPILKAGDESISAVEIITILSKAVGFFLLVGIISKFILPERVRLNWCGMPNKFVYKWGYRHMVRTNPAQSILCVLLTGLLFGLLALELGFHPGIGAYMGALILKDGYFTDIFDKEPLRFESFLNHHPLPSSVDPEHIPHLHDEGIHLHLPHIPHPHLPHPHLPHPHLPHLHLPHVHVPHPHLPHVSVPHVRRQTIEGILHLRRSASKENLGHSRTSSKESLDSLSGGDKDTDNNNSNNNNNNGEKKKKKKVWRRTSAPAIVMEPDHGMPGPGRIMATELPPLTFAPKPEDHPVKSEASKNEVDGVVVMDGEDEEKKPSAASPPESETETETETATTFSETSSKISSMRTIPMGDGSALTDPTDPFDPTETATLIAAESPSMSSLPRPPPLVITSSVTAAANTTTATANTTTATAYTTASNSASNSTSATLPPPINTTPTKSLPFPASPPSPVTPRTSKVIQRRLTKAKFFSAVRRVSQMAKEANEIQHAEESKDLDNVHHILHGIDILAMSWLGPVFFVTLGTKMVFVGNEEMLLDSVGQVGVMFVGMIVLQFTSASFAARYVPGGFNFVESVMIGLGMMGRAELAFVVLDIAYVQNKLIDQEAFFVLMFTCFLLNIVTPVLIMKWKPYYRGEKALNFIMKGQTQVGG